MPVNPGALVLERDQTLGRYRIVELIGSGGMGEVYLAEDTELQRRVALKLFTRDKAGGAAHAHLLHEARAASALSHPNVCTVFEVGEADGRPFIAMEYVGGRTLDALIAGRDLPVERIVRYGSQIADAIAHAHEHGVVHRDLKSANVVITNDGRAKVLDFGLASTVSGETEAATREVTSAEAGRMSGTLSYMAPEVLRGHEADPRSDIWALGVLLYEIAAGHLPFRGETTFELSSAIMNDSVELPGAASPGLQTVIQRCLQKAPGERYQSAAEVRAALETVQSSSTTSNDSVATEVAAAARATSGSNWTAIAAGFSVIAVIALALWIVLGQQDAGDRGGAQPSTAIALGASGRPTIAILPFRDRTGSEEMAWMAEGIPSMLVTGLAQTPGLDVVGNSRVQDIVSRLGVDALQGSDTDALSEFGARSGAGAVVVGDLYYTGEEYRIDAQVEDVTSGRVLGAYSARGPFVFGLVDELVAQVRDGLHVGADAPDARIADVTTESLEAWRAYDEGLRLRTNVRYGRALAKFEEAIALDPEFVLAKFQAARLQFAMADPSMAEEYDAYVREHLDRLSDRDRPYVEAVFLLEDNDAAAARNLLENLVARHPDHELAWFALSNAQARPLGGLGFTDEQLVVLERAVGAIPASGVLHNQLGYAYLDHGRYPEAVRTIERYVELSPEEANAYDSLAEVYLVSGQPELAYEKYADSLEVDPTWLGGFFGRANALAMMGRYDEALDELEKFQGAYIAGGGTGISAYYFARATMLSKLGRYDEAIGLVRDSIPLAAAREDALNQSSLESLGMLIAFEARDFATAHEFAERVLDDIDRVDIPDARAAMELAARAMPAIAELYAGDAAAARRVLAELRSAGETDLLFSLAGEIALLEGDLDEAERAFEALMPGVKAFYSAAQAAPSLMINNHPLRDDFARLQIARGDIDAAIESYRDLLTVNLGSRYNGFVDPRYVLKLAELLDEDGRAEEAREEYFRFIDFWSDADEQFQPMVERARARAAELGR